MAIVPFSPADSVPAALEATADTFSIGVSVKNIFTILGDYWTQYYADTETLKKLTTGVVELYSEEYQKLLEFTQCANIVDSIVNSVNQKLLIVFDKQDAEVQPTGELRFYIENLQDVAFLASSLFEAEVVLEKDTHFTIGDGYIQFSVDIFQDPKIINDVYASETLANRKVLLWAGSTVFSEQFIYDKWGVNLYTKEVNSENYRAVIELIQYYFVTTKAITTLEVTVNALMGLPFTRYANETVTYISETGSIRTIVTDRNTYKAHIAAELMVAAGDVLPRHSLLCRMFDVMDYVTDPFWFEGMPFFVKDISEPILPADVIRYFQRDSAFAEIFSRFRIKYGSGYRYGGGYVYGQGGELTLREVRDAVASVKLTRSTPYPMSIFWTIINDFLKYNLVCIKARPSLDYFFTQKVSFTELYDIIKSGFPVYLDIYWDASVNLNLNDSFSEFHDRLFVEYNTYFVDQCFLRGDKPINVVEYVGLVDSPVAKVTVYGAGAKYSTVYAYGLEPSTPFFDEWNYGLVVPDNVEYPLFIEAQELFIGNNELYLSSQGGSSSVVVLSDVAGTIAGTSCSGSVFSNDAGSSLVVTKVNNDTALVGVSVEGTTGGDFLVAANGEWSFVPGTGFDDLGVGETRGSAVSLVVSSDGVSVSSTLTVVVTGVEHILIVDDAAETDAATATSGNVLANDTGTLTVSAVNGMSANVGQVVAGSDGGEFVIGADGSWTFDPTDDFDGLSGSDTATTSVTYHASNGEAEASATLTVTVSSSDAQPWTPAETTTALWLDAADATTITLNGSTVSEWRDKSGNARHAAQATAGKQPARGVNWLSFDGSDDEMQLSNITTLTSVNSTMFIVAKRDNMGGRAEMAFAIGQASTANGICDVPKWIDDRIYSQVGRNENRPSPTSVISDSVYQNCVVGGSQQNAYTHGTLRGAGSTQDTSPFTTESGYVGSGRAHSASIRYFDGNEYEIIIEPFVLSDADRQIREGYLAHKWDALLGVTTLRDALPSDHTYKSAAPTL